MNWQNLKQFLNNYRKWVLRIQSYIRNIFKCIWQKIWLFSWWNRHIVDRRNIEKEFPAFEAYKGAKFHFQETGSWRIVTSIQECKSRDFSIPQLFFVCRGRKLCGRKYEWDSWILRMKQPRNRETARLSDQSIHSYGRDLRFTLVFLTTTIFHTTLPQWAWTVPTLPCIGSALPLSHP